MTELSLRLSRSPTQSEVRQVLGELNSARQDDVVILSLEDGGSGYSPAARIRLFHAIITWGRSIARPVLQVEQVPGAKQDDESLFLAASFAREIRLPDGTDVTEELLDRIDIFLESKNEFAASNTLPKNIFLPSQIPDLDHSPQLHALTEGRWEVGEDSRSLYHALWPDHGKEELLRGPIRRLHEREERTVNSRFVLRINERDGSEYRTIGSRAFSPKGIAAKLAREARVSSKPLHDDVGEVLFELFQNTEWHGRKLLRGSTGRSMRIIDTQTVRITRDEFPNIARVEPQLIAFLEDALELASSRSGKSVTGLQIAITSVVDSGLGLARSAAINLNEEHLYSAQTEIAYLIAALEKTIKVSHRQMGNIGLPRVQLLLTNLAGFMSIRTGHFELSRNFIGKPLAPKVVGRAEANPKFIDWVPTDHDHFDAGLHSGTAVTVVLPTGFECEGELI